MNCFRGLAWPGFSRDAELVFAGLAWTGEFSQGAELVFPDLNWFLPELVFPNLNCFPETSLASPAKNSSGQVSENQFGPIENYMKSRLGKPVWRPRGKASSGQAGENQFRLRKTTLPPLPGKNQAALGFFLSGGGNVEIPDGFSGELSLG